jgi:hypothetical protein
MTLDQFKANWFWRGTLSRWFAVYFFGMTFASIASAVALEHRAHGGTYEQAYASTFERGVTYSDVLVWAVYWAVLLWIVFFWRNSRLTDDDKRYFRLWTAASVILEVSHLFRYILRAI